MLDSSDRQKNLSIQLIHLDQKLIIFDIEQPQNATQLINLRRLPAVGSAVEWRVQSNAPTRYLVCPNRGTLKDDESVRLVIELIKNQFHPQHKMMIQAVELGEDKMSSDDQWQGESVQTIHLELGTTLMNPHESSVATDENGSLGQLISCTKTSGAARVKELTDLIFMLNSDNSTLDKNTEQTELVKETLIQQIAHNNRTAAETVKKLYEHEKKQQQLQSEVQAVEEEIEKLRKCKSEKEAQQSYCNLM